jgi:hypothetical protein
LFAVTLFPTIAIICWHLKRFWVLNCKNSLDILVVLQQERDAASQVISLLNITFFLVNTVIRGEKKYEHKIHVETHSVCGHLKLFQISQGLRVETRFVKATWKLRCFCKLEKNVWFFPSTFKRGLSAVSLDNTPCYFQDVFEASMEALDCDPREYNLWS